MTLETKMQKEAMELLDNDKRANYAEYENFVCLILAYYAVRIPKNRFYLDMNLLKKGIPNMFFSKAFSKVKKLKISDEMRKKGKDNIVLLKCDKFTTGINEKYLKLLTKRGCEMYADSEKSPVHFVLNGETYAICMPVTVK